MSNEPPRIPVTVHVPDELEQGVYANFLRVWHTPHDFTLDFGVIGAPTQTTEGIELRAPVVARVKVPVSVIFAIASAIAENVDQYEKAVGPITPRPRDGPPLYPPSEGGGRP